MCGIFAVLGEQINEPLPAGDEIEALATHAREQSRIGDLVKGFEVCVRHLRQLDSILKKATGAAVLFADANLQTNIASCITDIEVRIGEVEHDLDDGKLADDVELEALNHVFTDLKDLTWSISKDRLHAINAVVDLAGTRDLPLHSIGHYLSIQLALAAIDRLEVRGRDSAGISLVVHAPGLVTDSLATAIAERGDDLFLNRAIDRSGDSLIFVYKAAAVIGALGDNISHIRGAIAADDLLKQVLQHKDVRFSLLAHTRWASVGTISEPNAHPIDSQISGENNPCVIATLNGDVDNYAQLKVNEKLHFAEEITTDAKVIPSMVARRLDGTRSAIDAFRDTVSQFQGSVAISAAVADDPDRLLLAVHGSGQGCYIGFADHAFVVASEPYGLVEACNSYLRLDGETASEKSGKKGQVVEIHRSGAGTFAGLRRVSYGGEDLPFTPEDLTTVEITTRDIDRGNAEHFLLKEITESPQSVLRTLRGKVVEERGRLRVELPPEAFPEPVVEAIATGKITQVVATGQGTAAIASSSLVAMLDAIAPGQLTVSSRPATELSGFGLRDDMTDTLVVAVSQSGTTTDTNRTVDLVRSRGAKVIAIVNRRQSDLTQRADGVLYTSDGRDVEMSVASTKAFYAQVTACSLLAIAIASKLNDVDRHLVQNVLRALKALPEAMTTVLARRPEIARVAQRFAPYKRSWAIIGNGPNHIAACEVRIKLSELCYKSIACDFTEDKKHIDLSAEPMILVCAAGLNGSNASDVGKEVAIFRAHKATAIVIASEGRGAGEGEEEGEDANFEAAAATITVPTLHPFVDFILSTMVGHLFGYEAALAIDARARLMRNARAAIDDVVAAEYSDPDELLASLRSAIAVPAAAIFAEMQSGGLNGHLEPSTAVQMMSLLRYATGILPLDALEIETGRPMSPTLMITDLSAALTAAVNELTRPIDAVKHQAKTVTVGISRTEDSFAEGWLVQEAIGAGAMRDRLSYRSMRTLSALQPAVEGVVGYTRYEVQGDATEGTAVLRIADKGGVASDITSRVDTDPRLTGTKHRAAYERIVTVGRGQRDDREVIIVPESKDRQVTGITLLHVKFYRTLDAEVARAVLTGYRNRYSALVDAVTETEPDFDDGRLATIPMIDLLVEPVWSLAQHWRQ